MLMMGAESDSGTEIWADTSQQDDPDSDLEGKQFTCDICGKRLLLKIVLKDHILRHLTEEKNLTPTINQEWQCDNCNRTFSSETKLLCHKLKFPGHHRLECDECDAVFTTRKTFERHFSVKHGSRQVLTCDICSEQFTGLEVIRLHMNEMHCKKKLKPLTNKKSVKCARYRCLICPRTFSSSDGIKYHLATHTGEKRYGCDQCNRRFIKKTHLTEHQATHSDVKYFTCKKCPRCFSTLSAYKKHLKMFPGPHNFFCNKCGKTFMKESTLEKHLCVDLVAVALAPEIVAQLSEDILEGYVCFAEEADKEAAIKGLRPCCKCFKMFTSEQALHDHQNEHQLQKMYQCRFCPESFHRSDIFSSHIANHLGSTPYMCRQCNRKFISPTTLATHLKNYPGEHSFSCKRCKRWFPSADRLEKHDCILQNLSVFVCACHCEFNDWETFIAHLGKKPFKCCSCPLEFLSNVALTRHIKWHTGNRPFTCKVCDKNFITKTSFRCHAKVHENLTQLLCNQCNYKTVHQKRLDYHIVKRHEIPSSTLCPVCGVIFPKLSKLTKHLETEHGHNSSFDPDGPPKKSPSTELCTFCGKMLTNKYTLRAHMKKQHSKKDDTQINNDERNRPVSCSVCNIVCESSKLLRKHLRKHDTSKPFSCPRCGKQFKVSVSLKYHATICGRPRQKKEPDNPGTSFTGNNMLIDSIKWSH